MPKEVGLLSSHLIAYNRLSKLIYIGDEPLSGKVVYISSQIVDKYKKTRAAKKTIQIGFCLLN